MSENGNRQNLFGIPDARSGLGYGQVKNSGRYNPRQSNTSFPYRDQKTELETASDEEDLNLDNEVEISIKTRTLSTIEPNDSMARMSTNPFYFVAGNTKLSDCFWRFAYEVEAVVLSENSLGTVNGKSMSPFPRMYKHMTFGQQPSPVRMQGPTSGFSSTTSRKTGSKKGWSSSMLSIVQAIEQAEQHDEEGIGLGIFDSYDKEKNDERHLDGIKKYTNAINNNNKLNL